MSFFRKITISRTSTVNLRIAEVQFSSMISNKMRIRFVDIEDGESVVAVAYIQRGVDAVVIAGMIFAPRDRVYVVTVSDEEESGKHYVVGDIRADETSGFKSGKFEEKIVSVENLLQIQETVMPVVGPGSGGDERFLYQDEGSDIAFRLINKHSLQVTTSPFPLISPMEPKFRWGSVDGWYTWTDYPIPIGPRSGTVPLTNWRWTRGKANRYGRDRFLSTNTCFPTEEPTISVWVYNDGTSLEFYAVPFECDDGIPCSETLGKSNITDSLEYLFSITRSWATESTVNKIPYILFSPVFGSNALKFSFTDYTVDGVTGIYTHYDTTGTITPALKSASIGKSNPSLEDYFFTYTHNTDTYESTFTLNIFDNDYGSGNYLRVVTMNYTENELADPQKFLIMSDGQNELKKVPHVEYREEVAAGYISTDYTLTVDYEWNGVVLFSSTFFYSYYWDRVGNYITDADYEATQTNYYIYDLDLINGTFLAQVHDLSSLTGDAYIRGVAIDPIAEVTLWTQTGDDTVVITGSPPNVRNVPSWSGVASFPAVSGSGSQEYVAYAWGTPYIDYPWDAQTFDTWGGFTIGSYYPLSYLYEDISSLALIYIATESDGYLDCSIVPWRTGFLIKFPKPDDDSVYDANAGPVVIKHGSAIIRPSALSAGMQDIYYDEVPPI